MIRSLFAAGIAAGVLAGLAMSALHQVTTVPLILEAEIHEARAAMVPGGHLVLPAVHKAMAPGLTLVHGDAPGQTSPGFTERLVLTTVSTVLLAIGYALLVVAGMVVRGERPDLRRGVAWGAGGFVAFALAPALGVPPEIPGMGGGDILVHQTWWIATACATAAGLWLLAFNRHVAWKAAGLVLIVCPHLVGLPGPGEAAGGPPAGLAAQFAATSIAMGAVFWILIGGLSGLFYGRLAPD